LARIVGDSILHAQAAGADAKAENTRRHIDGWLEEAEDAYTPILKDMFGELANDPDLPDKYRSFFATMTDPGHQWDWLIQVIGAIGGGIAIIGGLGAVDAQPLINKYWAQYPSRPISPADAADMVERNIISQGEGEAFAAMSGISAPYFDLMVQDTGEPYGIEQALSLLRRGLISEAEFTTVLYYSRVRNDFLGDVLNLQWDTMTAGDAITAALKGVLDPNTAETLFGQAGGLVSQFQTLLDTAGDPIGVEQAMALLNHGYIAESDAEEVIRHSRINPIFENMALLTRFKFLAPYQVVQAVKAGTATIEQGTEWLLAEGYPVDQVTAVLQANAAPATAAAKEVTESQIAEMYEQGYISLQEAEARLQALGYKQTDTDFILAVYDESRRLTMVKAAVGQIRKVYLAGRIDNATATTDLQALGVDQEAIGTYLAIWTVEQQTELKELTAAQIGDSVKAGYMTTDDATGRWESMGYNATDAGLLLAYYTGVPPVGSPAAQQAAASAAGGAATS
jgi:hypothetical protein